MMASFRRVVPLRCLMLLGLAIGGIGCVETKPAAEAGPAGAEARPTVRGPVSEAEARVFAEQLVEAFESGTVEKFDAIFNWDAMIDQAATGLSFQAKSMEGLRSGMKASMRENFFFPLSKAIQGDGAIHLLRTRESDGTRRALFRVFNDGLNYHDYLLYKDEKGKVRARDIDVTLTGELLSETIHRMLIPLAEHDKRSQAARVLGIESEFVHAMPTLQKINEEKLAGKHLEAFELLATMPESVRALKPIRLMKVQLASAVSDAKPGAYVEAMEEFRKAFPGEPCVDLVSVDTYVMANQWAEASAAMERLDKSVGGDPFLEAMLASSKLSEGKAEEAHTIIEKAVAAESDLPMIWTVRAKVDLAHSDFKALNRDLDFLDANQLDTKEFEALPQWPLYLKSPEYAARTALKLKAKPEAKGTPKAKMP